MAIRGDTTVGAAAAQSAGMHLPTDFPASPTGGDTRSAAIATTTSTFLTAARTETATFNSSVDQLREGMVAAPERVDTADRRGAERVANSGETVTI
ncbi:hypothetical protein CQY20_31870 [Mycolicibacterium agri]|uniref:ESX-1 secretion-associated protein n=1 Tax=Mycolicibacterium agri TaxID=36811 RepID=A0A2A7MPG1_MYCAG|nr:hypothetical protein [Mycolicibacterium agri]PEG33231.1 hypothetical protein CQY20_31870 [Mycolicibacterium agri]